jgi:hypothetical protein
VVEEACPVAIQQELYVFIKVFIVPELHVDVGTLLVLAVLVSGVQLQVVPVPQDILG